MASPDPRTPRLPGSRKHVAHPLAEAEQALTHANLPNGGRLYAVYGGIYIIGAILWLWIDEHVTPAIWDITGCIVCCVGAAIIYIPDKING